MTESTLRVAGEGEAAPDTTQQTQPNLPTTRPAVASRHARRPAAGPRKVTRYTLDLEAEMHLHLRMFAVQHGIEASKIMRTLLYLLEAGNELPAGKTLRDLVLEELFADVPED